MTKRVRALRAFTLIEVCIVVAILGVMAALAAPSLLIEVQKAHLNFGADQIASFIARAQTEAMVSRRCVRVIQISPQQLRAERLNTFDCDNAPTSATQIQPAGGTWLTVANLKTESTKLVIAYDGSNGSRVCNECAAPPGNAGGGNEIRFRPNGRVFSNDGNQTNDDAIVSIRHVEIDPTADRNRQLVLVNGHGLICVFGRGQTVGTGPNFNCPN